ncbi:assimilatory sulfite reductase [Abortiporus biennis]|nr:assimilatory sulfite reductase [Abortiporus biennis]
MVSGISTPFSTSSTLSAPTSPVLDGLADKEKQFTLKSSTSSVSNVIEQIAYASSSSVYIYDLAEQAGFGTLTDSWAHSTGLPASVIRLQTRAGAGLSLVGRLSQGSSKDALKNSILTTYNTPAGLAAMVQSLSYLPPPTPQSRLVIQVPSVTPVGESFALSPTLAPFTPVIPLLPEHFTVLLSATPQEAVDLAALSYRVSDAHVIHIFDHYSFTREVGNAVSVPTIDTVSVKEGLQQLGLNFFDYVGDKSAETVFVVLNGPLAQVAKAVASQVSGLGVVVVRVLRPWDEDALRNVIPASAKRIHVLDDVPTDFAQGSLYTDVFSTLLNPIIPGPIVKSHRITPSQSQAFLLAPSSFTAYILDVLPTPSAPISLEAPNQKKVLFLSTPKSALSPLPRLLEQAFSSRTSVTARLLTDHDVFSKPGGLIADRLLLSTKPDNEKYILPASIALPLGHDSKGVADFLAVLDQSLLKSHSIATHAKPNTPLLIATEWSPAELLANLSTETLEIIRERKLRVVTVDAAAIASQLAGAAGPEQDAIQNVVLYLAFLRLYLGKLATEEHVARLASSLLGEVVLGINLTKISAQAWAGLVEIAIPAVDVEDVKSIPLKDFEFNAIAVETDNGETVVNGARLGTWHDAAKHILFPSAFTPPFVQDSSEFPVNPALRPEIPERTFLVTCTVNRRLTPEDYDRNVFHLEFDTSGTGLKYEIGEALGVHGWNDAQEVLDFCSWYGVDPNRVITIPVPGGDGSKMHTRTVFQALQQQVDLFGKPTKTFYSDLSAFATKKTDKYALQFIGSPEGSATFKKLSEKDTVTFADVLLRYESARPGIETLCELVGDIKPRHYSIASSQAVVGDRVDLLVVAVDWSTPSGSPRYGQCTRYLAGLKVGQKVTVSIRPSVMKLPPDHTQPIIMAGLGTGAAPFRAFLQYRAWLSSQNIPVGPTYYYFGSRHRSQEYLYGEEIEAFILDGTISKAGLAFSRDTKKKIYIQHKMREDGKDLARLLFREKGVFYLCGPTWPVPDVYEALVGALGEFEGIDAERAGTFLEDLKEEERYVLEVY